ncbi:hypothetical protein [Corynebacterium sp. H130]|uniref:hypothetical protein n=1 Tax=Corynebacterium sp. H130 TaxID=3133444 RepID=UPI0030B7A4D8
MTLRLAFDRKALLLAFCLFPMIVVGAFADHPALMFFLCLAVTMMVGLYTADTPRFRAYSLSRRRARRLRLGVAVSLATALCMAYLIPFLLYQTKSFYFVLGSALVGLAIQLKRQPEERWEPFQVDFVSHQAKGMAVDIVGKSLLPWLAVFPCLIIFLGIFRFEGSAYGTIGGGLGAMLGSGVVGLKNQFKVWQTFGGARRGIWLAQLAGTGATSVSIVVTLLIAAIIFDDGLQLGDVFASLTVGLAFQLGVFLGGYRRTNFLGPIVAFVLVMGSTILAEYLASSPVNETTLAMFGGVCVLWILIVVIYVPRRMATRRFGTTGLNAMFGTEGNINI